ncbi:MAG: ornithine cyclodeaminase family protein, partial [Deltaproteobacteria bacterium]|nr:ornithine cyclodeaminase family protein [Deltaproteobacteria bacterium]
ERYPTFTDLVAGKGGNRKSADDITLYLNAGNQGLQFAAVGSVVYEKARKAGLGR